MHFFFAKEPACHCGEYKGKGIWNWHSQRYVGTLQSKKVQYRAALVEEKRQEILCKTIKSIININLIIYNYLVKYTRNRNMTNF